MEASLEPRSLADRASIAVHCASPRPPAGIVAILDRAPEHGVLVERLADAVARTPRLRRRPVKHRSGPGHEWAEQPGFDLSFHLRWEMLGGGEDLLAVAAERFFQRFAAGAPPWELHVLEGTARTLVLLRIDPAFDEDGSLRAGILGALCADEDAARAVQEPGHHDDDPARALAATLESLVPAAETLRRSAAALLTAAREAAVLSGEVARAALAGGGAAAWSGEVATAALRTARSLGALVTAQLAENAPAALFAGSGVRRGLALIDLPLATLDAVRRPLGLALEDVLLAISAGALARLVHDHRGALPARLRVLVSLPEARDAGLLLPLAERDPLRRAAEFHELLRALGSGMHLAAVKTLASALTTLPLALTSSVAPRRMPRYDLSLAYRELPLGVRSLAGARVLRVYPLASHGGTPSLAIGAHRFDRWLSLGFAYDGDVVARPRHLVEAWHKSCGEFLHAGMSAQLREAQLLRRSAGRAH